MKGIYCTVYEFLTFVLSCPTLLLGAQHFRGYLFSFSIMTSGHPAVDHRSLCCPSVSSSQAVNRCPCKTCVCFSISKYWNNPHWNDLPLVIRVLILAGRHIANSLMTWPSFKNLYLKGKDATVTFLIHLLKKPMLKKTRWCLCLWEE